MEAEPAFGFHARPVYRAAAARLGQHNLPVKQCDHASARDGADDEGESGPRDRGGARIDIPVEVVSDCFGGCCSCVGGGIIEIQDRSGLDFIHNHDTRVLARLSEPR